MKVDRDFAANMFMMYRTLYPYDTCFSEKLPARLYEENTDRIPVATSQQLEEILREQVQRACANGKACLALSGGIDSAVLAKFMPAGSVAYTFKCVVPGVQVTDETGRAEVYAKQCGLEHRIVEIYWEDFEELAPKLMIHKGAPLHSIEIQIAKAAMRAKTDGFDTMIFGESADVNFGGLDGLLSKDYLVSEFVERFSYLLPYKALKKPAFELEPILKYTKNGYVDVHEFERRQDYCESMGSYTNAMDYVGVKFSAPYSKTILKDSLDYGRVRNGDSKYLVREIFKRLYPDFQVPVKIPMPRPMNEWMANWSGPSRDEFIPECQKNLTGDEKWMVWSLEKFLDIVDQIENKIEVPSCRNRF